MDWFLFAVRCYVSRMEQEVMSVENKFTVTRGERDGGRGILGVWD